MRPVLRIIRVEENERFGTFGILLIQSRVFCVTLEPADRFNAPFVSCIPAQQYTCKRIISPTFGETYEISNVPGRHLVLFHGGNVLKHTEGCILVAQHFGKLNHNRGILNSGVTFKNFLNKLKGYDEVHLTIKEEY